MPHFDGVWSDRLIYLAIFAGLFYIGYRLGALAANLATHRLMAQKEAELFTAQRGFKQLYETDIATIKSENETLKTKIESLSAKVEDYRKKAAGLGGLFNTGGKKADAMYALLMENEALEEILYTQNEKLKQERTDALKEQLRQTGYRRILMTQLLSDDRIKDYVQEVLSDEKRLPNAANSRKALPEQDGE